MLLPVKQCSTILWLLTLIALIGDRSRSGARAADDDDDARDLPPVVDKDFAKHAGHSKTDDESVIRKQESSSGAHLDGITADEMQSLFTKAEPHKFHTQEDRMMKLIINSLYKNKEIFLRELISNGSDALDKIKHQSITNPHVMDADPDLSIRIKVDPKNKMLHVIDSGVGMTKKHLEEYLGTIAKSETSEFLKAVEKGGDTEKVVSDLIGQFGVGFYSSFLVADKVIVTSKHNEDDQYIWESDSREFKVMKDPRAEKLKRGTIVSLHLKEEAEEYLDLYQLRNIAIKYSQFVNYPIYIWNEKQIEEEEVPEETVVEPIDEEKKEEKDEDVKVADEDEKPKEKKSKKVKKVVWYWEHLNDVKPIWQRNPKEVTEEDYTGFYKALTKKSEEPLLHIHFSAEGEVNFRSVIFIPKTAPIQYASSSNPLKPDNIKLYVRRVFISDQFDDFLPLYLSFVHGIVDSDDLPLNVSREMLQQHRLLKIIRKKLTRKILDTLMALDEEKYEQFWKEFGTQIKFGLTQDSLNRGRLAKLLRFYSSATKDKYTSLPEYVSRMRDNQKDIFFVAAASLDEAKKSPFVERVIRKGYEVLYLVDTADQFCLQNLPEFEGKKFQNVAKEGLQLDSTEKAKKKREQLEEQFEPLKRYLEDAFSDKILRVGISDRLVETPMVFVASQWGYDGNMERISVNQAAQKVGGDIATLHFAKMKRRMEINPYHPIVKNMLERVKRDKSDADLREYAEISVDVALIRSGYMLRDPVKFTERVENLLKESMKIPIRASVDTEALDDEDSNNGSEQDELERVKPTSGTKSGQSKENEPPTVHEEL